MPFESLRTALSRTLGLSPQQQPDEQDEVSLATACLMVELCQMDDHTSDEELIEVTRALKKTLDLSDALIQSLIEQARLRHDRDTSFYPYVTLVNEQLTADEKASLMRRMWRVAMADGQVDKYEEHYLRRLNDLLKLPKRTFLQTRHSVLGQ